MTTRRVVFGGGGALRVYTSATRPDPTTVNAATTIYDSDLNQPLWSDGAHWRDATGATITDSAPPNDNWADAWTVTAPSGTYTSPVVDNTSFTVESGEAGNFYKSAWWRYTPTTSGNATFDLSLTTSATGSGSLDTFLQLYTGSALATLAFAAQDDDSGGSGKSKITAFAVTGGVTYHIRATSYSSVATMLFVLQVTGPST